MKKHFEDWLKNHAPHPGVGLTEPVISIGAAAHLTGLSESALRKYEAAGLIIFYRTPTNRRMLSLEDLERIRLIQSMIKRKGLNLEGLLRILTLIPCWELKRCSDAERENCPASVDSRRPCWVLHENRGCLGEPDCRTCEVYRFGAYCTEDLKSLIRTFTEGRGGGKEPGDSENKPLEKCPV